MRKILILLATMILSIAAYAWSDWKTIKTENFTVYYKEGYEKDAEESMKVLETYRGKVEKLTGNSMKNVQIVIDDMGDEANGFADSQRPVIHHYTHNPGTEFPSESWLEMVGVHEYTHMLHMSKIGGVNKAISNVWRNVLPGPNTNAFTPMWIIEGITVYDESQISPFEGRLNDGHFGGYVALRAAEKNPATINEAIYNTQEYPFGVYYLYGGEFFQYLSKTYGEDKFAKFFEKCGDSPLTYLSPIFPSIGIDWSASEVYGKSFPVLWQEWWNDEMKKYDGAKHDGELYTKDGYLKDNLIINGRKLYFIKLMREKTGTTSWYGANTITEKDIDTGKEREIVTALGEIGKSFKINNGYIYYTIQETKPFYANATNRTFGAFSQLWRKNLDNGKEELILEDSVRGFEMVDADMIIYSKNIKGKFENEIVLYSINSKEKKKMANSGYLIEKFYKNGETLYAVAKKDYENMGIYIYNKESGEFKSVINTPFVEADISAAGDKLFFAANYDKKYRGYSIDLKTGTVSKEVDSFYLRTPVFDEKENKIYYIGLVDKGQEIFVKERAPQEFAIPKDEPKKREMKSLEELKIVKGGYENNLLTLKPNMWYPSYRQEDNKAKIGVTIGGGDAILDFDYRLSMMYSTASKKTFYNVAIGNNFFAPLYSTIGIANMSGDGTMTEDSRRFYLTAEYPLWKRENNGLTSLNAGAVLNMYDNMTTREISPYINGEISYPYTSIGLKINGIFERKNLGSSINRSGYYAEGRVRQNIYKSYLEGRVMYKDDRDNTDKYDKEDDSNNIGYLFADVRGYKNHYNSKNWTKGSIDFSFVPIKGKCELWNPNFYYEDIGVKLYAEGIMRNDKKNEKSDIWASTGIEVSTDLREFFGNIEIIPALRYSVDKDKKQLIKTIIMTNF